MSMQQPINIRLVTAGLLGGVSALAALYGNTTYFIAKTDMTGQRAYTIGNQYHMTHAVALLLLGVMAPSLKDVPGKVACNFCMAYLCFTVGTVALATARYLQCTIAPKATWLNTISQIGGIAVGAGWVLVTRAALTASA